MSSAMPHPRYAPHRAFISPAGRRGLWVVVFMLLVFELAFIATPEFLAAALPAPLAEAFWMGESRWAGLAQLASFGLAGLVFVGALRAVQRRGVWSLLGPRRLFWPMMLKAAAAGVLVLAIQFAAPPYTNQRKGHKEGALESIGQAVTGDRHPSRGGLPPWLEGVGVRPAPLRPLCLHRRPSQPCPLHSEGLSGVGIQSQQRVGAGVEGVA